MPTLSVLPAPAVMVFQPRLLSAYGPLVIAATVGILYLYRGRAFIVYWIGAWLFLAGALALGSRVDGNGLLGDVLVGLAALLIVWTAGPILMASRAFPATALRWT